MEVLQKCELKLSTGVVDGYHRLIDKYHTVPFGLLRIDSRAAYDPWLRYMVRSSSPGILAGDLYEINFNVADDTKLGLETQAYQRIYEMNKGGEAWQNTNVTVGKNALFHYVPHPLVPHKNSDFEATNVVKLTESSQFIWGEVLTCGRKHYGEGEVFAFKRLMNNTEIYVDDTLIFKDKILFEPSNEDLDTLGQMEGYTHQGTILTYQDKLSPEELYEYVKSVVEEEKEEKMEFGMTTTISEKANVVRILGNHGEQMYQVMKKIEYHLLDILVEDI